MTSSQDQEYGATAEDEQFVGAVETDPVGNDPVEVTMAPSNGGGYDPAGRRADEPVDGEGEDLNHGVAADTGYAPDEDVIVVAEVVDDEPVDAVPSAAEPVDASPVDASPVNAGFAGSPASLRLGQQWHDIQARFVDDPGDAVRLAAEAAEAAVSDLVTCLHEQRYAMVPRTDHDGQDTEQLRAALRAYRSFCQDVADLGGRLTRAQSAA